MKRFNLLFLGFAAMAFTIASCSKDHTTTPEEPAEDPIVGTWNFNDVSANIKAMGGQFDQSATGLDKYKKITFKSDGTYSLVKSAADGDETVSGTYSLNAGKDTLKLTQTQPETDNIAQTVNNLLSTTGIGYQITGTNKDQMELKFDATDFTVLVGDQEITAEEVHIDMKLGKEVE